MALKAFAFDVRTGDRVTRVPGDFSYTNEVNDTGEISLAGGWTRDAVDLEVWRKVQKDRSLLAVIDGENVVAAGPVTRRQRNMKGYTLTAAASFWKVFEQRLVLNHRLMDQTIDGPVILDEEDPDPEWRLGLAGSLVDIAAGLVREAMRFGPLPVSLPAYQNGPNARNYNGWDMATTAERLKQLTEVINGPELRFRPQIREDGGIWFELEGAAELIANRHRWNTTLPGSRVLLTDSDEDSTPLASQVWAMGGRSDDVVLMTRRQSRKWTSRGWPVMQNALPDNESVSRIETLRAHADERLLRGEQPQDAYTLKIGAELAPLAGDHADAHVAFPGQPDEVYPLKVLSVAGDGGEWLTVKCRTRIGETPFRPSGLSDHVAGVQLIPGGGIGTFTPHLTRKISYVQSSTDPGDRDAGKLWWNQTMNDQDTKGTPNLSVSVDRLRAYLPNCDVVSLVVGWFIDFDADTCKPMVEIKPSTTTDTYVSGGVTHTRRVINDLIIGDEQYQEKVFNGFVQEGQQLVDEWEVAGVTRQNAETLQVVYGETVSDKDVIDTVQYLNDRGYKVQFYPFLFGYDQDKTWRGRYRMTSAAQANRFINGTWGYKRFIQHYIDLCADNELDVETFYVGSEMVQATYSLPAQDYPFIDALVNLANYAHARLPDSTVTYAADWTEYHHDPNRPDAMPLDRLWDVCDVVSIDAYFPLTEGHTHDYEEIYNGWTSGEQWDYYYQPPDFQTKHPLEPQYAIKNIAYWWANAHTDRGQPTSWEPGGKLIRLSEIGFASVNATTVQPNVFVDPTSIEGQLPRGSNGEADQDVQRVALRATLDFLETQGWYDSSLIWAWDARPYPAFPRSTDWVDRTNWAQGHWIDGKIRLEEG